MPIDPNILIQAIGLGMFVSLIFSETLGLATGGMIVPGYVALSLREPLRIVGTIAVSLLTFGIVRFLSNYMLIYGRRRTVIVLLIGFCLGWTSKKLLSLPEKGIEMESIGYVIPGLIADWMERQGVLETITSLVMAAIIVRLLLIIVSGGTFL